MRRKTEKTQEVLCRWLTLISYFESTLKRWLPSFQRHIIILFIIDSETGSSFELHIWDMITYLLLLKWYDEDLTSYYWKNQPQRDHTAYTMYKISLDTEDRKWLHKRWHPLVSLVTAHDWTDQNPLCEKLLASPRRWRKDLQEEITQRTSVKVKGQLAPWRIITHRQQRRMLCFALWSCFIEAELYRRFCCNKRDSKSTYQIYKRKEDL